MKMMWNNFKVAFAMFSKIPMPRADWNKDNMKYMFCFFPFIGTVIGVLTMLAAFVMEKHGFDADFGAVVLTLIPVIVTGGIHVDGLLDTSDAMSSWQEKSRRLEILKDSNAGAFAVITACVYFLCWYGAYSQIISRGSVEVLSVMSLGFMVSRSLSGIGVITLPKAKADGTVAEFSRNASDKVTRNVLMVYLVLLFILMVWIHPVYGISAFIGAVLIFVYYRYMALKYFGGTTGDLAGFFLCLCEVGMALILAIVGNFC